MKKRLARHALRHAATGLREAQESVFAAIRLAEQNGEAQGEEIAALFNDISASMAKLRDLRYSMAEREEA